MRKFQTIEQLLEAWADETITPEEMVEELFLHIRHFEEILPTNDKRIQSQSHRIAELESAVGSLRMSMIRIEEARR